MMLLLTIYANLGGIIGGLTPTEYFEQTRGAVTLPQDVVIDPLVLHRAQQIVGRRDGERFHHPPSEHHEVLVAPPSRSNQRRRAGTETHSGAATTSP